MIGADKPVAEATGPRLALPLLVNLASLAFLAVAGLLLNVLIARVYGPEALGLFNIVFAILIFTSQLATFGVHLSALHAVSLAKDLKAQAEAAQSAVLVVCGASLCVIGVTFLAIPLLELAFRSEGFRLAIWLTLPAIFCFALNKVLLAVINAQERMISFALLQSLRFLLILAVLGCLIHLEAPAAMLILSITLAEAMLLPLLLIALRGLWGQTEGRWQDRIREHLRFGSRAMPSGVMAEIGTRVDVLMLGAMLGDKSAGIYSVALLLSEGFAQVIQVVRSVINPRLARIVADHDHAALQRLLRTLGIGVFALLMVGGTVLVLIFPMIDAYLLKGAYGEGQLPLAILLVGLTLACPALIFSMLPSQGGRPELYSAMTLIILLVNIAGNAIGISLFGMVGAAFGTAFSYLISLILVPYVANRYFGFRFF